MLVLGELGETCLKGPPPSMVQSVNGTLGLLERGGNLHRRQTRYMPENEHLPLVIGESLESSAQIMSTICAHLGRSPCAVRQPNLLRRHSAPSPQVVQCSVPRDPHDPCSERNLLRLVPSNRRDQAIENVARNLFREVLLSDQAPNEPLYVRPIPGVEVVNATLISNLGIRDGLLN